MSVVRRSVEWIDDPTLVGRAAVFSPFFTEDPGRRVRSSDRRNDECFTCTIGIGHEIVRVRLMPELTRTIESLLEQISGGLRGFDGERQRVYATVIRISTIVSHRYRNPLVENASTIDRILAVLEAWLLALWVGTLVGFAFFFAPIAFHTIHDLTLFGALIGNTLQLLAIIG